MKRTACGLLLMLPLLASAQETWLPPQELIAGALMTQPELRAALARVRVARAEARALDVGSHEYEASVTSQQRRIDGEGDYQEWETQFARQLRWPVKARLDRAIGDHIVAFAEDGLEDAEHQAARRLLSQWMAWLRTEYVAQIADQQAISLAKERDATARRMQLGDAALRELDLIEAECARAQAQALAAQADADAARRLLATTFPTLPLPERIPMLPDPQPLPGTMASWQQLIVERSHEIGMAMEDARRQSLVADRARADRRPDPRLGIRMLSERGGAEQAIGLVFSVPIGSAYRSARASSEAAAADVLQAQADGVRRAIEQSAVASTAAAESLRAQWRARQIALTAQQAAAARSHRAWQLGESGLSDWLLAERNAQQARQEELLARIDALEANLRVRVDSHALWHPESGAGAFTTADASAGSP